MERYRAPAPDKRTATAKVPSSASGPSPIFVGAGSVAVWPTYTTRRLCIPVPDGPTRCRPPPPATITSAFTIGVDGAGRVVTSPPELTDVSAKPPRGGGTNTVLETPA